MKKRILTAFALALACGAPATAGDADHGISPALLSELNSWLDAQTEFTNRAAPPNIALVDPAQAEALHGTPERTGGRTRGLYDAHSATIYLTRPWSPENRRDISVLLHEMVHHRQAGQHWYCEQAQEWRAYQIQAQWLKEQNIADDFYWPAIMLQSSCAKRDIHPE